MDNSILKKNSNNNGNHCSHIFEFARKIREGLVERVGVEFPTPCIVECTCCYKRFIIISLDAIESLGVEVELGDQIEAI